MNRKIILIALVLIVSCSFLRQQNQTETKSTDKKETPTTPPKAEPTPQVVTVVSCDQVQDGGITKREKVTLTYSDGQKESFSDKCLENEEPAFKSFKQYYYCVNLTVQSKLYNCLSAGNYTCSKGACI